jgi:hypothetical protein
MEPMAHKPEISTEPGPRGATGDNAALGDAVYVYELHRGHASVCEEPAWYATRPGRGIFARNTNRLSNYHQSAVGHAGRGT